MRARRFVPGFYMAHIWRIFSTCSFAQSRRLAALLPPHRHTVASRRSNVKKAFRDIDKDHSGKISQEEFRMLLRDLFNIELDDANFKALLGRLKLVSADGISYSSPWCRPHAHRGRPPPPRRPVGPLGRDERQETRDGATPLTLTAPFPRRAGFAQVFGEDIFGAAMGGGISSTLQSADESAVQKRQAAEKAFRKRYTSAEAKTGIALMSARTRGALSATAGSTPVAAVTWPLIAWVSLVGVARHCGCRRRRR